jgi:hypothetical protein
MRSKVVQAKSQRCQSGLCKSMPGLAFCIAIKASSDHVNAIEAAAIRGKNLAGEISSGSAPIAWAIWPWATRKGDLFQSRGRSRQFGRGGIGSAGQMAHDTKERACWDSKDMGHARLWPIAPRPHGSLCWHAPRRDDASLASLQLVNIPMPTPGETRRHRHATGHGHGR